MKTMGFRNWRQKSQESNSKRGQGSSWTVTPVEEEEKEQVGSCGVSGKKKLYWGRFSPSTSVSPANSHSTNCSTLLNYLFIDAMQCGWQESR
jgi:hypothetical protein